MNNVRLLLGDCRDVLKTLPDNSVDSIVTDPPYGLSFMGKKWDYDVPGVDVWVECLRVLKPGGHLLAFAGTRTQHRMACRIEDAGFEIRDIIAWVYGSGFPKSHNLDGDKEGWGTALKPALEPITVARKPFDATVAQNVQEFGTGALNIAGCRIETDVPRPKREVHALRDDVDYAPNSLAGRVDGSLASSKAIGETTLGRWPANFIHDGSEEVVALFPVTTSGKPCGTKAGNNNNVFGQFAGGIPVTGFGDTGSAARFFYCPKASKTDRDEGLDHMPEVSCGMMEDDNYDIKTGSGNPRDTKRKNAHPTVKPTALMRYLCRLVTPPNGTVLDPFNGSGSTGKGAVLEGFSYIGIEREAEHIETSKGRIAFAETQCALPTQMSLI